MSIKDRMKRIERKHKPVNPTLSAILPDWLQPADYVEPVVSPGERVIVPKGYQALQPDGSVKWHD